MDWSNSGYFIRHKWKIRDVLYPNKKFYVFFCFTSKSAATIMSVFSSHNKAWTSGNQNFVHILLPFTDSKNSKWVWSGNSTITNRRQPRGTARKSLSTITRHQEDKLSKATSSLYPIKTFLNESTEWWRMTVEINLLHDQSSLKYRTGPGSNSLTPWSAVRHASVVTDCAKRPGINKYVKITRDGNC